LESSLALDKIIESSSKLERSTPLQAKVDILSTKARILNDLGFSARAQDVITEMKSFYEKEPPARLLSLELEMGFRHLPLEDFREEWGRLGRSEDEDVFKVYLLQRGMKPELTDSLLERTPRGALALKTFAVFESQKGKDKDILWRAVADLEALLKKVSEPRMEKIALHCYQAQLHPQEVQTLLEKAELELARWGSDTQGKWLFELWIKSLRGNVNLFSAENFRKIDISLRERWETWFKTTEKKQGRYVLKTIDGSSSVDKAPSQGHARAVTLIEDLGKVFLNGSLVEDFNRKSVLRQMLALFLEVFPDKLSKANLASALWGEIYSPQIHDARIYTSIQRLRALIDDSAIENWDGGYRWSPGCAFYFYRSQVEEKLGSHRVKTLILESLRKMSDSEN
ncbi:MAG TPA: hypothetical protein VN132_14775, partial [Bdellovibrio sp.]|nr:hypothetical protein [Bdellovibrio sp.]